LGVPAIELDVRLTRDGALVVIHDATLERTTDARGRVAELALEELRRVSAGHPAVFGRTFAHERVPLLAEVIGLVRDRAQLLVELKTPEDGSSDGGLERATVETLRHTGVRDAVLLSFDHRALSACRALASEITRGLLFHQAPGTRELAAARALECRLVLPEKHLLSRGLVDEAHAAGLEVATWIVDEPRELDDLMGLGLVGVGSNRPRALLAHLAARETGC
jgi:glycerophosphoryl diester phosphodiesterase